MDRDGDIVYDDQVQGKILSLKPKEMDFSFIKLLKEEG